MVLNVSIKVSKKLLGFSVISFSLPLITVLSPTVVIWPVPPTSTSISSAVPCSWIFVAPLFTASSGDILSLFNLQIQVE